MGAVYAAAQARERSDARGRQDVTESSHPCAKCRNVGAVATSPLGYSGAMKRRSPTLDMSTLRTAGLSLCLAFVACDQGEAPSDASANDTADTAEVFFPDSVADTDTTTPNYTGLVINEIEPSGSPDDWFELYNGGNHEIDLSGVGFSDDRAEIKATFPWGTKIKAGQHLVVIASDALVGFKLGKDEGLVLVAPDGTIIDEVTWTMADAPAGITWGRWPDGRGDFQYVIASPGGPNSRPEPEPEPICGDGVIDEGETCDGAALGDKACTDLGFDRGQLRCAAGCGGYDTSSCENDIPVVVDVVINEVTSEGDDAIEIVNRGATTADLSGWSVTDDQPTNNRWTFPAGSSIAAGQRRVLRKDIEHTFGLGGADKVSLWDATGALVDETTWNSGQANPSWCRLPDATGPFQTCQLTLGASNRAVDSAPAGSTVVFCFNETSPSAAPAPAVDRNTTAASAFIMGSGLSGAAQNSGSNLDPEVTECAAGTNNARNASNWATGSSRNANKYFELKVAPGAGTYTLTVDLRASGTGPTTLDVIASTSGTIASGQAFTADAKFHRLTWTKTLVGGQETIRIYGYDADANGGTLRIDNVQLRPAL